MHDPGDEKPAYARQGARLLDGSVCVCGQQLGSTICAPDPQSLLQALSWTDRGAMGDWVWEISADGLIQAFNAMACQGPKLREGGFSQTGRRGLERTAAAIHSAAWSAEEGVWW